MQESVTNAEGGAGRGVDWCTITVAAEERAIREGETLVLDNTFPHSVENAFDPGLGAAKEAEAAEEAEETAGRGVGVEEQPLYGGDRFVLMIEVWHPGLSDLEVASLRTLFALKDLYTVLGVRRAPWGFTDAELEAASERGVLNDLAFWRDL